MKEIFEQTGFLKNSTTKLLICLAILFVSNYTAFAQADLVLTGRITTHGAPLQNTELVLIQPTNLRNKYAATTDANGNYRFENVKAGFYVFKVIYDVSNVNFTNQFVVNLQQTEAVKTFNAELINENRNVPEYLVTVSSGSEQSIDEVSKSVTLIGEREILNRNEIDFANAVRTVPGVRVQQSGGFGRLAAVKIRGLRNQDTAVLIDGQRLRDPSAITGDASAFISDLLVANVSRIEVLRGSGSSLYGTNAIGGVFDIRTDDGGGKFHGSLLGEGGGRGFGRGQIQIGEGFFDNRFKYSSGFQQTYVGKGIDGDDLARNTTANGKAIFALNQKTNIFGSIFGANSFVQLNSSPDFLGAFPANAIVEARPLSRSELRRYENGASRSSLNFGDATFIPDANDPDASQKSRFLNFNVGVDGVVGDALNYRASYQNLTTSRRNFNGAGGVRPGFFGQPAGSTRSDFDGNIQTVRAAGNAFAGSNTITFGYEFERERFGNDNFALSSTEITNFVDAAQNSNTVFVQNQTQAFNQRLQLSGALRAQFFNLETPNFSADSPFRNINFTNPPNALTADGSIAYFFRATNTKLRGHAGNGYRAPSLYERFGSSFSSFSNSFTTFGSPDLKPERSIAVDAGIDQSFANNRARLSATYFYTRLIDVIGFANSGDPRLSISPPRPFGGYVTQPGFNSRGAEFSGEYQPFSNTNVFASYTFTNSDQRQPQISGSSVLQTLGVPAHQFTAVVTQRVFDRLNLNFDFVGTSSYFGNITNQNTFAARVFRFRGQRRGDLTAAYEIPTSRENLRVRLFGTVENVFNQDYYENGFRTQRATGRGGLQLLF